VAIILESTTPLSPPTKVTVVIAICCALAAGAIVVSARTRRKPAYRYGMVASPAGVSSLVRYTSIPHLHVPAGTSLKPNTNRPCARVRLRERWYNSGMTSLLDDAIEVLRSLPENVQAAAARTIIDSVGGRGATAAYAGASNSMTRHLSLWIA
jgi:hypothetical protein